MLKGLDPRLGPDLLAALRSMGHGDEIAIVDANFPATALATRLCRADGHPATDMVKAILSVLPLDDFAPCAAFTMAPIDAAEATPEVVLRFAEIVAEAGQAQPPEPLERHAFYERARRAFAVVATGEARLYGNLILVKGVIRP